MAHEVLLEDDGYVNFTVRDPDGKGATIRVDLFAAWSVLSDAAGGASAGKGNEAWYTEVVHPLMDRLEFPARSTLVARRFADAVLARVKELEGNGAAGSSPDSPGRMEPASSD